MAPELSTLVAIAEFLQRSGPLAIAVLCGYWAWKKDGEAKELREAHEKAMKATFDSLVALTSSQTTAVTKMEASVDAVKDLLLSVRRSP